MLEHGGNIYKYADVKYDFSANINPFGISKPVKESMLHSIEACINYPDPDCTELRMALSQKHRIPFETIAAGNGGADIIFRLIHVLRPKKALIPVPTFLEYEQALKQNGCEVVYYYLKPPDYGIEKDFLDRLFEQDFDFTVICNPNNPTGRLTSKELIQKILKKNIFILIDECFLDMTEDERRYSLIQETAHNMLILKSLTKMYAIPGVRVGYGISPDQRLIEQIKNCTQAWPVSLIAQEAGCAAAKDIQTPRQMREFLSKEGTFLYHQLKQMPEVFPLRPTADFIFFHSHTELWKVLLKKGFMIRDCRNYPGLSPGAYRIAIKTHEQNLCLIRALRDSLKQIKAGTGNE